MGIWEGILSAAGLIALGWYAHVFFHRREHDDLKQEIADLQHSLEEADKKKKTLMRPG